MATPAPSPVTSASVAQCGNGLSLLNDAQIAASFKKISGLFKVTEFWDGLLTALGNDLFYNFY